MDEFKFKSLEELYRKLLPALRTKVADLRRSNVLWVKEIDIWNYLKVLYWRNKKDLTLGEMVNDILSTTNEELIKFVNSEDYDEVKNSDRAYL